MTANKKCQTICIIVSTVTVVGIILFILQQYVMTMKTEDKGPITMKVINPTFNETSSDSSSHSWLMSGSAAGTYSNSRLRSRDDIDLESSSSSSTSSSLGMNLQAHIWIQEKETIKIKIKFKFKPYYNSDYKHPKTFR